MKNQNRSQYLIALSVIACSLILLGALTFAITGYSWKKNERSLMLDFRDATGIKPHSAVRFAGKVAGAASEIRYLTPEERARSKDARNAVRVLVKLNEDVPPLRTDVTARIEAESLLGEKFIALIPGAPDAPLLAPGTVIQGAEVSSIDAIARSAQETLATVNELLERFRADYPTLVPRVADLLNQGAGILMQGSNLVNNVDATVSNANGAVSQLKTDYSELIPKVNALFEKAQSIAGHADEAVEKMSGLVQRADGLVAENQGDLAKILDELRVASQNLKVITTYAKSLTATLAEKPSNLIWSRKRHELPSENEILESGQPVPTAK